MRFEEWKTELRLAAGAETRIFPALRAGHAVNFADLCRKFSVPMWRTMNLVQHQGRYYQLSEDEQGVISPFEDWECTRVDEAKWLDAAMSAPLDYISSYVHRIEKPRHSHRMGKLESGIIELGEGYEGWLASLNSKSRYHVRRGLSKEVVVTWHHAESHTDTGIEQLLEATARAHPNAPLHAQALVLWTLAREATFVEVADPSNVDRRAVAGFVADGDTQVFYMNVRTDPQWSDISQRLLAEAVRKFSGSWSVLDLTEKTLFHGDEDYGVYKSKVANASIFKYAIASVSGDDADENYTRPFYRRDLWKWELPDDRDQ